MATGGSNGGGGGGGPDWLGLLKWSLKCQDGTHPTELGPMDQEKLEFLNQVMNQTFMDVPKRMREIIAELEELHSRLEVKDEDKEEMEDLWGEIRDHTEHLDFALVFCQLGGLPTLMTYCFPEEGRCQEEAVRCAALGVLATLTQNNPKAQEEVFKVNPVPRLAHLVCEASSTKLAAKALQALSCTIRGSASAEEAFLQDQGFAVLSRALESSDERLKQRGLFLLQALWGADHATRERGEALLPLLPSVINSLDHEDVGITHTARLVVGEMCNLVSTATVMEEAGGNLESMKAARRQRISEISDEVELEEAEDELRFWRVLDEGGPFLRDGQLAAVGEAPLPPPPPAGGVVEAEDETEEAGGNTPVLLLEPQKLSGASQAP